MVVVVAVVVHVVVVVVVVGAGHLRRPPLLSVFDITLKTTS